MQIAILVQQFRLSVCPWHSGIVSQRRNISPDSSITNLYRTNRSCEIRV